MDQTDPVRICRRGIGWLLARMLYAEEYTNLLHLSWQLHMCRPVPHFE
jgi:hypothetical protein